MINIDKYKIALPTPDHAFAEELFGLLCDNVFSRKRTGIPMAIELNYNFGHKESRDCSRPVSRFRIEKNTKKFFENKLTCSKDIGRLAERIRKYIYYKYPFIPKTSAHRSYAGINFSDCVCRFLCS